MPLVVEETKVSTPAPVKRAKAKAVVAKGQSDVRDNTSSSPVSEKSSSPNGSTEGSELGARKKRVIVPSGAELNLEGVKALVRDVSYS